MLGGSELRRQIAELNIQVANLQGRLESEALARAGVQPVAATLGEVIAFAEFHCRELSAMAAEVLQLGYGYDSDTVQLTWTRFAAGDRQAFFSALTGPGGEGLAVHLGNAAEDPDYGEDFSKALIRLVDHGKRFLDLLAKLDGHYVVRDFYHKGPLGEFLGAVRNPAVAGDDSPAAT